LPRHTACATARLRHGSIPPCVARCNDDQAGEIPAQAVVAFREGIQPKADVDAQSNVADVHEAPQILAAGAAIDARHQQALGPARLEQPCRLADPRLATGQHHDAIGGRRRIERNPGGMGGEKHEAQQQHGEAGSRGADQHGLDPSRSHCATQRLDGAFDPLAQLCGATCQYAEATMAIVAIDERRRDYKISSRR
jgi:hypothetical protein